MVGFYETLEGESEILLHTALLIGYNGQIFQQSGTCGIIGAYEIRRQKSEAGIYIYVPPKKPSKAAFACKHDEA